MNKKYKIIYADPPWRYDSYSLNKGGAARHYNTMSNEEIIAMPIDEIADENSVLIIWATFPKLQEALDVIKGWGFKYKTCAFVWIKTNKRTSVKQTSFVPQDSFDSFMGMGSYTRSNAEICLLGIKGKPKRLSNKVRQIIYSPLQRHSEKPAETRERIVELFGDLPRIELFARESPEGWDVFGNEVKSDVKL